MRSALLLGLFTLLAQPGEAFEDVFAVVKYDRDKWMEHASMDAWADYAQKLVTTAQDYGFTGLVLPPTAPVENFRDPPQAARQREMRDKQLLLLDTLHTAGMRVILVPGNPGNAGWGRSGPDSPAHRLYTHPSVVAIKQGDEPNAAEYPRLLESYRQIRSQYPEIPIVTAFVGEPIGGPTGTSPDMLPTYLRWWHELDTDICMVRQYPFRSRNRPARGQVGDYDLQRPYVPAKLAVAPREMARLTQQNCPGGSWALVGQTFGLCAELGKECFWRFPTSQEIIDQAEIAFAHNAKWFIAWSLTPHKDGALALLDDDFNPTRARDGRNSIDAIWEIRRRFVASDGR